MIRVKTNVVLKYFEPLDEFIRIRIFTPAEAKNVLRETQITDRKSYIALVLNACLLHYNDQIVPQMKELKEPQDLLERKLFDVVVEINPSFDLRKVTIEVPESEASSLHLLEKNQPDKLQDFSKLKSMEADLTEMVIGQSAAVHSVTRAIRKALTGLRDQERPIASLFFVGQTGVGKTELAKALTQYLYQDPSKMLRVDCSEFALPHEYAKLIGAPPGYVGYEQEGLLKRNNPVVLFDEVEKSDSKVHNLLLQLMDEGFVSDNKGQRIPFNNAIVILTSNVGSEDLLELKNRMGFDAQKQSVDQTTQSQETMNALKKCFRLEFLNRLSDVVLFGSLDLSHCEQIAEKFLGDVRQHAAGVPLTLQIGDHVPRFLAEKAYNPEYGAREVKRTVEREVEDPLSEMLIEGDLAQGDKVHIRVRQDKLHFHRN